MISQYPLRIDSVLMDQLKKEANQQKRSLNNLLEVVLTEFVDALKDEKKELQR